MDAAGWTRIKDLFAEALALPRADRAAFVAGRCAGDEALATEIRELLDAHDRSTGFLDVPALIPARDMLAPPPAALEGRQIGPFRLTTRLGAGGMGVVYRGERIDGGYEQHVAIKSISLPLEDNEALSRFRVERQILANLAHPNIVAFIDGGLTDDHQAFLVMELVDGVPLTAHCRDHHLELDARLRLFEAICGAVQYAHQHGVVHRDLKPGNILVTSDGVVKVLDFGVAKLQSPDATDATRTGLVRPLTPDYASPEQLRGLAVTTASDIYALGVLLYELLSGARPYETTGQPLDRVLALVATEDPRRASQALARSADAPYPAQAIRGDLDAIVLKAMQKDPMARYASAQELADDLRRFRASEPVIARERSFGYLIRRAARRHRAAAAAAVVSFVAVMAALGVSLWQTHRVTVERDRAEARFNDARALAQALIFKVHDGVAGLPGSIAVRKQIVDDALIYLERLSRDPAGDDALRRELAAGYRRIGDVQGNPSGPDLGDRAGSRLSYERAINLLAPLAEGPGADPAAVLQMGGVEVELSGTLAALGDSTAGVAAVKRAIARAEALQNSPTQAAAARTLLAAAYFRLATATPSAESLPAWTRAGELYEALLSERPDDAERQRNVALVEKYLGGYYHRLRKLDDARTHYERAKDLDEKRLAAAPQNRAAMFDVAIDLGNVGSVDFALAQYPRAAESLGRSVAIREEMLRLEPKDVQAKSRLAFALNRLAAASFQLKQRDAALAQARRAVDLTAETATVDDAARLEHASNLWTLADIQQGTGQRADGCKTIRLALVQVNLVSARAALRTQPLPRELDMRNGLVKAELACR